MFALILLLICVLFMAAGQVILKIGMGQMNKISNLGQLLNIDTLIHIFTNPLIIGGILSCAISLILWLGVLSNLNISYAYPMASLAYVITIIAAFIFLKENITLLQLLGIIFVVGGCLLIVKAG